MKKKLSGLLLIIPFLIACETKRNVLNLKPYQLDEVTEISLYPNNKVLIDSITNDFGKISFHLVNISFTLNASIHEKYLNISNNNSIRYLNEIKDSKTDILSYIEINNISEIENSITLTSIDRNSKGWDIIMKDRYQGIQFYVRNCSTQQIDSILCVLKTIKYKGKNIFD